LHRPLQSVLVTAGAKVAPGSFSGEQQYLHFVRQTLARTKCCVILAVHCNPVNLEARQPTFCARMRIYSGALRVWCENVTYNNEHERHHQDRIGATLRRMTSFAAACKANTVQARALCCAMRAATHRAPFHRRGVLAYRSSVGAVLMNRDGRERYLNIIRRRRCISGTIKQRVDFVDVSCQTVTTQTDHVSRMQYCVPARSSAASSICCGVPVRAWLMTSHTSIRAVPPCRMRENACSNCYTKTQH
jgi:hypothetical protein